MRACAPLLPEPGNEVVLELLDEIERLRAVFEAARAVLRYGGPERFGTAWRELDKAVQAVLVKHQGDE